MNLYVELPDEWTDKQYGNFMKKVKFLDNGCYLWTGARSVSSTGQLKYAIMSIDGKTRVIHRYLYIYWKGEPPAGYHLDHVCKEKGCVNIEHLEPVTVGENVIDRSTGVTAQQADKTHCPRGHEYDNINTAGSRTCTKCQYWLTKNSRLRRAGKPEVWPDWWTGTMQRKEDGAWDAS